MKFSADDIARQTFQKSVRGYDIGQVHEFLEGIAREWVHLVESVERLQITLKERNDELLDYRRREKSLVDALEMAKRLGDDIRHQAQRDAELIVGEAELKAEKMLTQAESKVIATREELLELQHRRVQVDANLRHILQSHLNLLDALAEERSSTAIPPIPPGPVRRAPEHDSIPVNEDVIISEESQPYLDA